jgi:hypothetical protein
MRHVGSELTRMRRVILTTGLLYLLPASFLVAGASQYGGRIRSEHIRIKIPIEREWLGREAILELEECWRYVNRATGEKLPRVVLVDVDWTKRTNSANLEESSISIGMDDPAAATNMKGYLLHGAAKEMARLGLTELSRAAALRDENQFLVEAMSEILAREYDLSTKGLDGAWVIAHFLDRIKPLGLDALGSWLEFSGGRRDFSTAAPGITFLMTCREQYGKDKLIKLFEALKKGSLKEALSTTFRSSAAVIEDAWLRKLRAFNAMGDLVATSEDDAPHLRRTVFVPPAGRRGTTIQIRLFFQDARDNLNPYSVFVEENGSKRVLRGREPAEKGERFTLVDLPVDQKQDPGNYEYRITAVDESGNVRSWEGSYTVEP